MYNQVESVHRENLLCMNIAEPLDHRALKIIKLIAPTLHHFRHGCPISNIGLHPSQNVQVHILSQCIQYSQTFCNHFRSDSISTQIAIFLVSLICTPPRSRYKLYGLVVIELHRYSRIDWFLIRHDYVN